MSDLNPKEIRILKSFIEKGRIDSIRELAKASKMAWATANRYLIKIVEKAFDKNMNVKYWTTSKHFDKYFWECFDEGDNCEKEKIQN